MAETKIMTDLAVKTVKTNIDILLNHYKNNDIPEKWISDFVGEQAFIKAEYITFDDFDLVKDDINASSTELENIKLLYSHLSHISDAFASDERLWAGLSHTAFHDFVQKRWAGKELTSKDVLNHYFFRKKSQRALMINTLSRYWWTGRRTYRPNWEDPWKITNYLGRDIVGYGFPLLGSNWSNDDKNIDTFFTAVFALEEQGYVLNRDQFIGLMKFMNCLCGMYLPGICENTLFTQKLINFAKKNIFSD